MPSPQLLASVTGPLEAATVIRGGADIVDLKNPADGALGAVEPDMLLQTILAVMGRRQVSAVAGNVPLEAIDALVAAVAARASADFVKVGLFPASRAVSLAAIEALGGLANKPDLVAVFFADADPDLSLLPALAAAGFRGAMLDTMTKGAGRLLDHRPVHALGAFVAECRGLGLLSGLAGSLEPPDVPRLAVLGPNYLGFRGALTGGGRADEVDERAVRRIRGLIDATAGAASATGGEAGEHDLIRVTDLTLPLAIGAYAHERGREQRVRFDVEAAIDRIRPDAEGVEDVYSYDLILDAIRGLAARGHTDLVERLALDLAEMVLADRRVHEVRVRVEKLDLGPDAVGIEIRRRRTS